MTKMIDLRSDTVTKPTLAMRNFMVHAEVGDDVMGEDPTVNRLESYTAKLLGKESALFVATGTQANLLSLLSHCQRGEEYIAGEEAHIYKWEACGSSVLGGLAPALIPFEEDGTLDLEKVKNKIKPNDPHFPVTRLLCLENTQAGKALPLGYFKKAASFVKMHGLKLHLDGARLFNAAVSLNVLPIEIAIYFDSVSLSLSKGLGAPVGSLICGSEEFIQKARRLRKMVGGGMRQAGIIAAAGQYALENNIDRLEEDHKNAELLANGLNQIEYLKGKVKVHTNIVFVEVGRLGVTTLPYFLRPKNILILGKETLRLVTHLDVTKEDMETVVSAFQEFFSSEEEMNKSYGTKFSLY